MLAIPYSATVLIIVTDMFGLSDQLPVLYTLNLNHLIRVITLTNIIDNVHCLSVEQSHLVVSHSLLHAEMIIIVRSLEVKMPSSLMLMRD